MTDAQIEQLAERLGSSNTLADAITKRLMNGPLREAIREEVDGALGPTARKVDDLHAWMNEQNRRITDLEVAND